MSTVVVTGGAGFIGSHCCEMLLQEGYEVVNVDSFHNNYDAMYKHQNVLETYKLMENKNIHESAYTLARGDIRDVSFLKTVFERHHPQFVIHLAACAGVRASIENPALYTDINVNGTMNILEACRQYQVKNLIFASSSSVYGNNVKVPFREEDKVDYPISPYAATKKAGELLCHTYSSLYGMNVTCLRFFTVYGPRQRPDLAICRFVEAIRNRKPIEVYGDGLTARDYTYISDIIEGVHKAMIWNNQGKGKYEIFNLGGSQTTSLKELIQKIEVILEQKAVIDRKPLQQGDVRLTYADITKAGKTLGYYPKITVDEGLHRYIRWAKDRGGKVILELDRNFSKNIDH